jgi:hypothetical protein
MLLGFPSRPHEFSRLKCFEEGLFLCHVNKRKKMKVVIIGAGLAGLYAALVWTVRDPTADIEIFEASERVGGRIFTVHKEKSFQFEGGAGRIGPADAQPLLWRLMKYLDLLKDIRTMSERVDVSSLVNTVALPDGPERRDARIQFGYDAEFETLDRTVATKYIRRHFGGPFYYLEHGLEQITHKIYERLQSKSNVHIHLNTPVRVVTSTHVDTHRYDVLFVCVDRLDKIRFEVKIPSEVHFSKPIELNRIFVRVRSDRFDSSTKRTGPGPIRMWIPMGTDFAQIYTDSHWAVWWKQQPDETVRDAVRTFLGDESASVDVVDREFWKRGVHVWTRAVRSSQVPFGRIWFAGELFATESFGWMEGALETVRAYFTD